MASVRARSVDEVAAYLKQTPLFMTSLGDDAAQDNNELEAMRALQYEGTRAEIAQGFRESGNEMAKAKKWADSKEFYTKGLTVLTVKENKDEEGQEEDGKEREIEEACYINRALCHLELSTSIIQETKLEGISRCYACPWMRAKSNDASRKLPLLCS